MSAKIGLICPVYGYPGFLTELATGILNQKTSIPFCAVLVDDCCPDPETIELCKEYAFSYPDIFHYIRPRQNAGLSRTRNAGVEYALATFPQLQGVTFLDADDRIYPTFIERSYAALQETISQHKEKTTSVGWVFEDPYRFGIPGLMRRLRKHSLLWNMVGATQTSSSIMSAEMFRSGLRYSEEMRYAGEDWEFSLRAYKAGFRGFYKPAMGFRWRRRPGSMSASAAASLGMERNRVDIRMRHADLYRIDFVTDRYAEECPHYCLIDETGAAYLQHRIGDFDNKKTLGDVLQALSDNAAIPATPAPQFFIFAHSSFLERLKANRRLSDFYARVNCAGRNGVITNHLAPLTEPAAPGAPATFRFMRQTAAAPGAKARIGAVSMTRETFLRLLNPKRLKKPPTEHESLAWPLTGEARAPRLRADEILAQITARARSVWPAPIKPASRIKEEIWNPAGMAWRDLPPMLTGLKETFPEPSNRRAILLLAKGEDLADAACLDEFLEFAEACQNGSPQQKPALAVIDAVSLDENTASRFRDIYLIPKRLRDDDPRRWADEKMLQAIAASFGCVVSCGVMRLNDHTAILRKNGVKLIHKLYRQSRDFEHGRALITMFKAYNGFVSASDRETQWLRAHGAPSEIILSFEDFQSEISNR